MRQLTAACLALILLTAAGPLLAAPLFETQPIFPFEGFHNHASCIIECPNGDLLACWYRGVGPERGDDVQIWGARKPKGADHWGERFLMADTPDYPDDNPCMFVDAQQRLWLLWPTLLANRWETAVQKYRISSNYQMREGPPVWEWQDIIPVTPANFEEQVKAGYDAYYQRHPEIMERLSPQMKERMAARTARAADELQQRLGWMTRAHPTVLPSGRLIVGLYTDAFSVSIMAITDDLGKTWLTSNALVGPGSIQPSVVRKNDGTLVAMMRDAGRDHRIKVSESKDDGMTWGAVRSMDLPNPGSGLEVIRLANGHWALAYNDTEAERASLAVSISDDEGATWKWTRHLERNGYGAYPSIVQSRDGMLHVTYSGKGEGGQSIEYARFNEEWVMEGDPR